MMLVSLWEGVELIVINLFKKFFEVDDFREFSELNCKHIYISTIEKIIYFTWKSGRRSEFLIYKLIL